ncbi:MAG: cytochrome c maturation protein CcmE [Pseudomonadota bacterium]
MAATRRRQRMTLIAFGGALLVASAVLVGVAFEDTIALYKDPSVIIAEQPRPDQRLQVGGLVMNGSVERGQGRAVTFAVTDGEGSVTVDFVGILPDLFREGQGVVVEGFWRAGRFEATEVLAKHDENYIPKEVADSLKERGLWQDEFGAPKAGVADGPQAPDEAPDQTRDQSRDGGS